MPGKGNLPLRTGEASQMARNEKQHALLLRSRRLPAKRRGALLDLIRPAE